MNHLLAKDGVITVSLNSADGIHRIQILDCQFCIVICLCIISKVLLDVVTNVL
jgi:hypothetical protein